MKTIRTLLVDDEPPARDRLRRLLKKHKDIEIVGEAADGEAAICAIAEHRPDLLFLDIQMPAPDGLAVLRAVRDDWLPCTIFTTAHAQHAVTAFELHALDYLLKPYTTDRFNAALDRARARFAAGSDGPDERVTALVAANEPRIAIERFLVKNGERYTIVRTRDILWAEAAGNYMVLHTTNGNHVLRRTVNALESELDPKHFFRTSRSAIVHLDQVAEIEHAEAGEFVLRLRDNTRVPLTRGLREIQQRLEAAR
jgi:two-component system, LytTR family, response regulator